MEIAMYIIGFLLMGWGFLGCFVDRIPGPLIAFIGILTLHFGTDIDFATTALILVALMVAFSMFMRKRIPALVSKIHPITKAGKWGSVIGSLLGLFLLATNASQAEPNQIILLVILAFVVFPFVLSFLFELVNQKDLKEGLMSGSAAYVSYFFGALLNLAICCYGLYAAFTVTD